jgi:phosphoglycolate phosphatase-like HAD superfamily hydrolase
MPEHCQAALRAINVSADQILMVGDSITDMHAAKKIGAITIGIPTGVSTKKQLIKEGANYIITSISDLPKLIKCIENSGTE